MVRGWLDSMGSLMLALFLSLMIWLLISDRDRPMQTDTVPPSGGLALQFEHVPDGYVALSPDDGKVRVVLRGFEDAFEALDAADFRLAVDLAGLNAVQATVAVETPLRLPVAWHWREGVGWADRRRLGLRAIGTEPTHVMVRLDPIVTSTLRVDVELTPSNTGGFELGESTATPAKVQVTGPRAALTRITRAVAMVDSTMLAGASAPRISDVPLVAMDAAGSLVDGVVLAPGTVAVTVDPASFGYRLPVVVEPRGNVPPGYDWRGLTYEPKEVHVFGPDAGIQQLLTSGKVSARPIDLGPITRTVRIRSPLQLPPGIQAVGLKDGLITVTVQVDVLPGSQQFTVVVEPEGVPPGLRSTLSPLTVLVVLRGDRPVLDLLNAEDIRAVVSARRLSAGVHRVAVDLRLPPGIERVSVSPETVELQLEAGDGRPGG